MSIEFHAVSIPRDLLEKYRGTTNLHNLFVLSGLKANESSTFEELEPEIREGLEFEGEFSQKRTEEFKSLLSAGEIPVDGLSVGREWAVLSELFEAAPTVFGKCFGGGEDAGKEGLDVLWGESVQVLAAGLLDLEVEEEELQGPVSWLTEFYSKAAANDWAVLRCVT